MLEARAFVKNCQALQTVPEGLEIRNHVNLDALWWTPSCSLLVFSRVLPCFVVLVLASLRSMAGEGAVDIDLYATVDEFEPEVAGQHHLTEGLDLYDDVLTTGSEMPVGPEDEVLQTQYDDVTSEIPQEEVAQSGVYEYKSYTTVHPKSAAARSSNSYYERTKGQPLYVGNLTWWTNDQELTEALQECGVTDLINIKFFENRTNGQSKGFAMIELGSDTSVQLVTEKLPKMEIHSQLPVVTPATKQYLQQFEAQSRKNNPGSGNSQAEQEAPPYQHGGGRGFGFNRGGFRGRGFPVRPGMGGGFDHRPPPPGDMGRGAPWMGPGHMGMPRHPPPGMPPYRMEHPPPFYPMVPPPGGDKPLGPMPPQVHVPPPPPPGAGPLADHRPPGMVPQFPKPPVAAHVNPAFFPEGPLPETFLAAGAAANVSRVDAMSQFMPRPGDEFSESMKRNQVLASSAIKRAMSDANSGDYESGIETLVGAISLIKQSPTAAEERCQVLVQSLQDCLQGLEMQLLERRSTGSKHHYSDKDDYEGETREKRHRRRRSRSRSRDRDRRSRSRDKRSRSRDRERRHRR
ncbi:cleavage and polyadenylation specificity factor subunit 6-like isoform X3 [Montipora foliosa]|uniref:cleavage and polyadenylation specificity factor subunit 6-like isoform X3 n=2 Tax=Montipora TaxID=46703 RepID=UPI0035F1E251